MRKRFAELIYDKMAEDKNIWILVGDLGYKMWDRVRDDFSDRFINVGAAEHSLLGIACGLALEGKIPFVYSATTFLLYRAFEVLRNYINHERIPVRLVGSGRNMDYMLDGFSHWACDADEVLNLFPNITQYWPENENDLPLMVAYMTYIDKPSFISLRR